MMETLRIQPPLATTSNFMLKRDAKVGDLNIRKGDEFMVQQHGVMHNAEQWPNPHKFIPERFDTSSPHSKTANG